MARVFLFTILALLLAAVTAYPAPSVKGLRSLLPTAGDIADMFKIGFARDISVKCSNDTINNSLIEANFTFNNPTLVPFTITNLKSSVGLNGTVFATIDHTFEPSVNVPSSGGVNSGLIPKVFVTQDAIAGLNDIINQGYLDITDVEVSVEIGGVPLDLKGLGHNGVPTTYDLAGWNTESRTSSRVSV